MAKEKLQKENKKSKLSLVKKGLMCAVLGCTLAFSSVGLVACDGAPGKDGTPGNSWITQTGAPTAQTQGNVGDMYLNTITNDLYKMTETGWVLIGSLQGGKGEQGNPGEKGDAGSDTYIGYDGNIWKNDQKTEFSVITTREDGVYEDSLGVNTYPMNKHFEGKYIDLSTSKIALMNHFLPNAELTAYSGTTVEEITIYAEKTGYICIGTAKVAEVVSARKLGLDLTTSLSVHSVTKGKNVIALNLEVGDDETIVLGGNNSVGIYYAEGVDAKDDAGNFTLINGEENASILSMTSNIADTLAIKVKADSSVAAETQVFPQVTTQFPNGTTTNIKEVVLNGAPYAYKDTTLYAGKTITKIGIYAGTVTDSSNVFITIYKAKQASKGWETGTPIKIQFTGSITKNTWIYADCNIQIAEDEMIAFGAKTGDTILWQFSNSVAYNEYKFNNNAGADGNANLLFDIYVQDTERASFDEHIAKLEEKEAEAELQNKKLALQSALAQNGIDNISFLGDSITTYTGWSNNATDYNSTIGSNAIYYSGSNCGITSVEMTWWKQVMTEAGLDLCVNNSWSGDKVTGRGNSRASQLHDNTGNPDGGVINPDMIIVYLGINDFDGGVSATNFAAAYDTMINTIVTTYANAKVYVCTLVPNGTKVNATTMASYNETIRSMKTKYGVGVIDFNTDSGITQANCSQYMGDGSGALHPNPTGMDLMTDTVIRQLIADYVED